MNLFYLFLLFLIHDLNIFLFLKESKLNLEYSIIGNSLYLFFNYKENIKLINKLTKQNLPIIYVFNFEDVYYLEEYLDGLNERVFIIIYFE